LPVNAGAVFSARLRGIDTEAKVQPGPRNVRESRA
jgi:hypothetical protein